MFSNLDVITATYIQIFGLALLMSDSFLIRNVKMKTSVKELIIESKSIQKTAGYSAALEFLEQAHLKSQPFAVPHFIVHFEMFKLALQFREWKEVLGQVPRLFLAMPGSWLGKAPKGNVGSTRMGIFEEKF